MDSTEFLPVVSWETVIYDVALVSEATEEEPAVWECTIKPKDQNDDGVDIPVEIDYQLIDNAGHIFRVTNKDNYLILKRVQVTDVFRCGWCPQPDLTGVVCKTVGNGVAPYVSPAMLDRLDETAKDYLQSIEKDILWKYPKDINEKWHPEGLLFTADSEDDKIINWLAGKIVITLWPENLISDYVFDYVVASKAAYHPERVYDINLGTFTCPDDDLHYIYAVLPIAKAETTGSIVIEKTYRPERYYTDMITILLGTYTIPDIEGRRTFLMQWGIGEGGKTITVVEDHTTITNIISNIIYYDTTLQQFISYINNEWIIIGGGNNVISGDGMDFITNTPVTLGLPSEVNSTTINEVTEHSHTHKLGDIDISSVSKAGGYGALYNWYAAVDSRKISSSDNWIIPSLTDIENLLNSVDTFNSDDGNWPLAGGKLKEIAFIHWDIPNLGATNEYKFNAIGSGSREGELVSKFMEIKISFRIWSNTENELDTDYVWGLAMEHTEAYASTLNIIKTTGYSIRLCNPSTTNPNGFIGTYTQNNGVVIPTIVIGGVEWTMNLIETKFRDGSWIHGFDRGRYRIISDEDWAALSIDGVCFYENNAIIARGGQIPLADLLISEHNKLKGLQGGTETERYHLTAEELAKIHPPVTIAENSTDKLEINENQVLAIKNVIPLSLTTVSPVLATDNVIIKRDTTAYQAPVSAIEDYFNTKYSLLGHTHNYLIDAPADGAYYARRNGVWAALTDLNNYPTALAFTGGTLTLSRAGLTDLSVSLDGRYLQSYTETDPVWNAQKVNYYTKTEADGRFSLIHSHPYLSDSDSRITQWNTAYTNRITSLTTTGNSGAATLSSNTLNIPNYTLSGLGGEPALTKGNLTTDATGLQFDNTRQVIGGAAKLSLVSGYCIPTTTQISQIHASGSDNQTISSTGTAGNISLSGGGGTLTLNVNDHSNRTALDNVSGVNTGDQTLSGLGGQPLIDGTGFVKASGTTISYDNSTYEPAFSKNTAFNKNFGTTAGTVLEGRTFGNAANSSTGDFIQNQYATAQSANAWISGPIQTNTGFYQPNLRIFPVNLGGSLGNTIRFDTYNGNSFDYTQSFIGSKIAFGNTGDASAMTISNNIISIVNDLTVNGLEVSSPNNYSRFKITNNSKSWLIDNRGTLDSPNYRLSFISPDLGTTLYLENTTNNAVFGGNVGIGYSTGTEITNNKLAVNGSGYFNGALTATTAKFTNLTDGYIPYHISDASGLGNSPIYTDGSLIKIGNINTYLLTPQLVNISSGNNSNSIIQFSDNRFNIGYSNSITPLSTNLQNVQILATSVDESLWIASRGDVYSKIKFYTSSGTSLTERLIINGDGNVGIGYSTGTEITNNKLAVNGSGYFNGALTATTAKFTTGAASNSIFVSDAVGLGSWRTINSAIGANSLTTNFVPKWNGSNFINSALSFPVGYDAYFDSNLFIRYDLYFGDAYGNPMAKMGYNKTSGNIDFTICLNTNGYFLNGNNLHSSLSSGYLPYWDGTKFVNSVASTNGTAFKISNLSGTETRLTTAAADGTLGTTADNSTNWNTAYSWGNHANAGYLTRITSSQVTTALGYTPYNSTNPAGYITSSALSGYATQSWVNSNFDKYDAWFLKTNGTLYASINSGHLLNFQNGSGITWTPSGSNPNIQLTANLDIYGLTTIANPTTSYYIPITSTGLNSKITISQLATLIGSGSGTPPYTCTASTTNYSGTTHTHAITGFLPLTGGTLTGALYGTSASFSGDVKGNTFTLGTSLWTIEVASGKLVFKYNGTALMSLDTSGNIKAAAEGYRGGV